MNKLVVGPFDQGIRKDRTAFIIDNDSFPELINAYQWRGRIKRKRGTELLGRLQRSFVGLTTLGNTVAGTTLDYADILTTLGFTEPTATIVPGSVVIAAAGPGPDTFSFTDQGDGSFTVTGQGVSLGSFINYATGQVHLEFNPALIGGGQIFISIAYYPDLPVMGLEDLVLENSQFPGTIAFDTTYSYDISPLNPYTIKDVSFYKNPLADAALLPGYTPKASNTPLTWNGQNYRQFWSVNYQNALWETNGVEVPFNGVTLSMQFRYVLATVVISVGPPAILNIGIAGHNLVPGDFLFFNEFLGTLGDQLNFQTGYVISVVNANTVQVEFPLAAISAAYTGGGIAQYLTNTALVGKDTIRWYDGDPTSGTGKGWVNFNPPLSQFVYSIANLPPLQYYLVSAKFILPFKDRLMFFGPVIQASGRSSLSVPNPIYLQDTVIFSQNGTPYYTASFNGSTSSVDSITTIFSPILVPNDQTATPVSFFEDQIGFGGFISAGYQQPINGGSPNEDAIIVEFETIQSRFVYTGNDVIPFAFFLINSELGCSSTFSVINMDEGILSRGDRGLIITSQTSSQRIDLDIPDQVFEMSLLNNGSERVTAQRDFINEWVYFTYPSNENTYVFPTQTLQYNYRDDSWGIFNESYTTYGQFRRQTGETWLTIRYNSWIEWNEPWIAGGGTLLQPKVIAGNQQGFVMFRDQGTNEDPSLYISNIANTANGTEVTSPDHCLNTSSSSGINDGDYIVISGVIGTVGAFVNGKIFSIRPLNKDTFVLNPSVDAGTYLGGGVITRMYIPLIQTKQFPMAWDQGRKTRIGVQQYLFTTTSNGQIAVLIYLSQNGAVPYNVGPIIPELNTVNDSLIYSTVLYTCPETTNLGLTTYTSNLQIPTAPLQAQTWHRINTSLIGDTIQIGFTMSDSQMRDTNFNNQFAEIELHGFILNVSPSMLLV